MNIINFQDRRTSFYAELWSIERISASIWYGAILVSENKGDIYQIGAQYKIDIPAPCFLTWEGTLLTGTRSVKLIGAADLERSPGANFYPIYPGVNLVTFGEEEPTPEPEPDEPPDTEYKGTLKLVIFVPRGSVPFLVRPEGNYIREDIKIIGVSPEWYDNLLQFIQSAENG